MKTYTSSLFSILLFLFFLTNCQLVRHQKNNNYTQATQKAATIIALAKEEVKAPAISVAIGIDNRVVWAEAWLPEFRKIRTCRYSYSIPGG